MSGIKALSESFSRCASSGRAALIPFLAAGDPDFGMTKAVAQAAVESGADIIEVGFPFSDPVADGPVIQAAYDRALAGGATTGRSIDCAGSIASATGRPVVVMASLNLVLAMTPARFCARAADAGVAGLLIPDLLADDAQLISETAAASGLATIFLAGPRSDAERLRAIARASTGFVYVVRRSGVTGSGDADTDIVDRLSTLRAMTSLPLAVGFGVSTPDDVRAVAAVADGVIVGSALVETAHRAGSRAPEAVADLVRAMSRAAARTAFAEAP